MDTPNPITTMCRRLDRIAAVCVELRGMLGQGQHVTPLSTIDTEIALVRSELIRLAREHKLDETDTPKASSPPMLNLPSMPDGFPYF